MELLCIWQKIIEETLNPIRVKQFCSLTDKSWSSAFLITQILLLTRKILSKMIYYTQFRMDVLNQKCLDNNCSMKVQDKHEIFPSFYMMTVDQS